MYLIRDCELPGSSGLHDVRVADGVITAIAHRISAAPDDVVIEAGGAALLPGLQDHHIHLSALAASLESLHCGPPGIATPDALAHALRDANEQGNGRWLRGIGYHHCVAGDIDRDWLDRYLPDRPARIQHRGGRLWLFNTAGLHALGLGDEGADAALPQGIERRGGRLTGRLYDCDEWLRERLQSTPPDLDVVSARLASHGVTHLTDTSPGNGPAAWQHLLAQQQKGHLRQHARVMGSHALADVGTAPRLALGEYKIHLLESQLPGMDDTCNAMLKAHAQGRNIAVHCVTLAELSFILDCFERAGSEPGDRIEHASVVPDDWFGALRRHGLRIVTQPHFISERGDQYLEDVSQTEQRWLYRLRSFLDAGVPLAAGSDAPFGGCNPWQAMAAAVSRKTPAGRQLGAHESLTPEQALALYTSSSGAPGVEQRAVATGQPASLCLLQTPWRDARLRLAQTRVAATWRDGELIYRAS